jgi:L-cysteine S-thiosulfotransferase
MSLSAARWVAAAGALLASTLIAWAEHALPYVIKGDAIAVSLTGQKGDPQRGRAVVASRQTGLCLLCHAAPIPEIRLQGNIGPDLKGVATRWNEGQLRLRIVDSSKVNADTIMPSYYRFDRLTRVAAGFRDKPVLTPEQIEDVVAYLLTLRD